MTERKVIMATNILYEGDGFLRSGPEYLARTSGKAAAKPADRKVKNFGDAESVDIEKREMELRRAYLPEWVCRLLEA